MKKTLVAIAAVSAVTAFAQSSVQITGMFDAGFRTVDVNKNPTAKQGNINSNNTGTSNITFRASEDLGGGVKIYLLGEMDPTVERVTTLNQSASTLSQTYTSTSGLNSETFIALSGNAGDIKLGTPNSPAMTGFNANAHPFGTAMGGGWSSGFGRLGISPISGINQYVGGPSSAGRIVRSEKAMVLSSATYNGVQGQLEFKAKNGNGGYTSNDNGLFALAANYTNGPLKLAGYSGKATAPSTAAAGTASAYFANTMTCYKGDTSTALDASATAAWCKASYANAVQSSGLAANENVAYNMFSGNYTMGDATIYAGYSRTKGSQASAASVATSTTTTVASVPEDSKSWNIAGKYVMGNYDLLGNYLVRKSGLTSTQQFIGKASTSTTNPGDDYTQTARLIGLGLNYNMSKTSMLYARYERIIGLNASSAAATASTGTPAVAAYGNATQTTSALGFRMSF